MSRQTSTTVYLSDDQLTELRTAAARRRVPMAQLIREGIERQLRWELETANGTVS